MAPPARPELTLPPAEAGALRRALGEARVVLEYGSGGSTLLAAERAARVFSVESDPDWLGMMAGWFALNPPKAKLVLHHADIGPVKAWGAPENNRHVAKWPGYATSVWERPDFVQPDLVLVDGRFRLACFLTVALRVCAPVTLLWDDYAERPAYHIAERLAAPVAMHGRMAEFHLTPQTLDPAHLAMLGQAFVTPQ